MQSAMLLYTKLPVLQKLQSASLPPGNKEIARATGEVGLLADATQAADPPWCCFSVICCCMIVKKTL
jgi:hypothetical protein